MSTLVADNKSQILHVEVHPSLFEVGVASISLHFSLLG